MLPNLPSAPLSVSQLNRQVKQLLETQYPSVPVQGEISTLSRPASGHIYFTLKDNQAQIRCAMFKGQLARNKYLPKQGDEVIVYGRLSLYEGRGDYQLIVNSMQPVGEGALQAAFFKMKDRLAAEGLFNEDHKKALPTPITTVGIVTSSTGAALHDILTVLNRRFPALNVILYPTQVQGNEAAATIVSAIVTANMRQEVDILIVGRGGGSLEDLWCFNTEPVARAIFASDLPIISAVGHEVDVSIADFAADIRAATPSQAAEMVSPDQFELMQRIDQAERRLINETTNLLKAQKQLVTNLRGRLRNPAELVNDWSKQLDGLTKRLQLGITRPLASQKERISNLEKRLSRVSPSEKIKKDRQLIEHLESKLLQSIAITIEPKKSAFQQLISKLNVLSPLATLDRGYSITRNTKGNVIQNQRDTEEGETIETILNDGKLISTVTEKINSEK